MENILRAERKGVVVKINADPGGQPRRGRRDHGVRIRPVRGRTDILARGYCPPERSSSCRNWKLSMPRVISRTSRGEGRRNPTLPSFCITTSEKPRGRRSIPDGRAARRGSVSTMMTTSRFQKRLRPFGQKLHLLDENAAIGGGVGKDDDGTRDPEGTPPASGLRRSRARQQIDLLGFGLGFGFALAPPPPRAGSLRYRPNRRSWAMAGRGKKRQERQVLRSGLGRYFRLHSSKDIGRSPEKAKGGTFGVRWGGNGFLHRDAHHPRCPCAPSGTSAAARTSLAVRTVPTAAPISWIPDGDATSLPTRDRKRG